MPARTGCCWYSVRSYVKAGLDGQGETNWTADYWAGSTNTFTPGYLGPPLMRPAVPLYPDYLQVAVDAVGNVYVTGPRATSADGASHWNFIKYDGVTGAVIYKADLDLGGATNNLWSVLYFPDDGKIWVLSDAQPTGRAAHTSVDPSTGALAGGGSGVDGPSLKLKRAMVSGVPVVQVTPYPINGGGGNGAPQYQSVVGSKVASLGQPSDPSDTGAQLSVQTLPIVSTFPDRQYRIQGFTAYPYVSGRACDMIAGGSEFLLAASATLMHFSDVPPDSGGLALFDTGLDTGPYPMTYRWKRSTADVKTFLKFQDSTYLATYGVPPTSTMMLATVDGSKVWAHYHQQVTDIAFTADSMITVGFRKRKSTDLDFT